MEERSGTADKPLSNYFSDVTTGQENRHHPSLLAVTSLALTGLGRRVNRQDDYELQELTDRTAD